MKTSDLVKELIATDTKIKVKDFYVVVNEKDPNHLERKQQQRAISNDYILIAINYGVKSYTYNDIAYTITDRCLIGTIYEDLIEYLRGVRVVGYWGDNKTRFYVRTALWSFEVKTRKRF